MKLMKMLIVATASVFAPSCGPDDVVDEDTPPGELVYADAFSEIYRLDRRVEVVAVDPRFGQEGCGYLTDRAVTDIERTIERLDPSQDYVADPEECETKELVYIDGFDHSPFECVWLCCHPDLVDIALVYLAVFSDLSGQGVNIDGELYVALEPDRPCE